MRLRPQCGTDRRCAAAVPAAHAPGPGRHRTHPPLATDDNELIAALPRPDRLRLVAAGEPVELVLSEVLCEAGAPTTHAYFPRSGFVSLVTRTESHPGLEVGMVGREGLLGVQLVLGVGTAPLRALVQGPGIALRLEAAAFREQLAASVALRHVVEHYLYVRLLQMATASTCLRFHMIGPRLARWLLMSQDRAHADHFRVTHEFLAYMLGVRRVGITVAAGQLQRDGLITYHRGELNVLDRAGLEAAACSCYAADLAAHRSQFRPPAAGR